MWVDCQGMPRHFFGIFPVAEQDMRLGDVWAGIYPMRPDGRPVVGPHPGRPSVITIAGAGGSGLQSSPALGQIAAEWIIDGRPVTIPAAVAYMPST